ncbi:MAG: hypothetical protein ACI4AH_04225 [Muribaculaceae bacterium]
MAKTVYCFTVHIAEGLAIEGSPDDEVNVDTDFGSVKERFALSSDGRTVTFMQEIALKAGVFEPTRNADFKAFRQAITECFTRKLVIKHQ